MAKWLPAGQWKGLLPQQASTIAYATAADELAERPTISPAPSPAEAVTRLPSPPTSTPSGSVSIPGYEVLGELGRGGMGVVYKAQQTRLKRVVALKMILAGQHAGADALARFRVEAEAIARLQHPGVVQIHDVGEHEGKPFFALEFVDGGSLARQLDGSPWKPGKAAALVEQLARTMHAVHQKGVIHRDLKPANVLLTTDGQPKITDFGLAKQLDADSLGTASGAVMGTPSYMAPEQAGGKKREIGPTTDVYALGAILYELLTGRPPFKAETPLDTILQVVSEQVVPPRQINPKLSQDLEAICLKCLVKKPEERYASAEALAEDLARFLSGEPIQARQMSRRERLGRWLKQSPRSKLAMGAACVYFIVALIADAFAGSYITVPLLALTLLPFLWPNKWTAGTSFIGVFLIASVYLFACVRGFPSDAKETALISDKDFKATMSGSIQPPRTWEGVFVNLGLAILRGVLIGSVGLGIAILFGRKSVLPTVGALAGFLLGSPGLAAKVLEMVEPPNPLVALNALPLAEQSNEALPDWLVKDQLVEQFAPPNLLALFNRKGQDATDDPSRFFDPRFQSMFFKRMAPMRFQKPTQASRWKALLFICGLVMLPVGLGALLGCALAEKRASPPSRRRRAATAVAGSVLIAGLAVGWSLDFADARSAAEEGNRAARERIDTMANRQKVSFARRANLILLGTGMVYYHNRVKNLPRPAIYDKTGSPLLSWRVAILPYLAGGQHKSLYDEFHLDEPWDSEHNKKLLTKMPAVFAASGSPSDSSATFLRVFVSTPESEPGALFMTNAPTSLRDVTDGTSNTLIIVEAGEAVPWTKPDQLLYAPDQPLPKLGGVSDDGFFACFADGSARFITKEIYANEKALRQLITRNGGENADLSRYFESGLPVK